MSELAKLNLCFVAGTLGQGGAERQLFYLLSTLHEAGAKLHVCCLTRGEFWEERLLQLGIPVTWIGQSSARPARLAKLIQVVRTLQPRPQVIQSQHFYTNLYATAAARLLGLREIGALRGDAVYEVWTTGRLLGRLGLRLPRTLAANSQAAINKLLALGVSSSRLQLLRNVVDTDHFAPVPRPASTTLTLAGIGRLMPQKRFDLWLEMLAQLRARATRPIRAVLAGAGPLRGELERQAADLGLNEILEFKNPVADPREIYGLADVLVSTSDWEGTPNVVLEAMAMGVPVVATDVGDVAQVLHHGETGMLVQPGDSRAMLEAVFALAHDDALRKNLGHCARSRSVSEYSLAQLPQRLQSFYQAVLA